MKKFFYLVIFVLELIFSFGGKATFAQSENIQTIQILTDDVNQRITGFGASLAYYEGWLTAHPNRSEIYDVIFNELSLDILRVRNAFGYNPEMIDRVREFAEAAENSLGHPIDIMVTSWGPPAYLKSNNDRSNGGTLKYTISNGKVNFDYSGFAKWWDESLDNYNANGIFPKYLSIQNEPDWTASYESCLLRPAEVVNSTDTIAGYNRALDAVYDTVIQRDNPPLLLGPECVGIGYNSVENYINELDVNKLYGIGHHLYHGAESGTEQNDPFTSSNYQKVGNFHSEVPHFQTEYSRSDWYSLAAMMFQSLTQENVTAFLYWDLIWNQTGLVNLHFPWDQSRWTNEVGYNRNKDFYVFKHYSAFIHPGWTRIGTTPENDIIKTAAFISPSQDSVTFIVMNRSESESCNVNIEIPGYEINTASVYSTTEDKDFALLDYMTDKLLVVEPKSVNTVSILLGGLNAGLDNKSLTPEKQALEVFNNPNPFSEFTNIQFVSDEETSFTLNIFDVFGNKISSQNIGSFAAGKNNYIFYRDNLIQGIYFYQLTSSSGKTAIRKLLIID